jgi:phage tail-like protein
MMTMPAANGNNPENVRYLNRDGLWLGFKQHGLEMGPEGTLRLASLPILQGALPPQLAALDPPGGSAGIAVGPDGTVYFSDPARNQLLRIDGCDGSQSAVRCVGGEGDPPTQFRQPHGVLFHPIRQAIFVADSGNHRIQIFEPDSFQLTGVWGQEGTAPGQFRSPRSLASDAEGSVYVVDYGNRRLQKFDHRGVPIPEFWANVERNAGIGQPIDVAVSSQGGPTEVYILDDDTRKIFAVDAHGTLLGSFELTNLQQPLGLAAGGGAVYVGDNQWRRVVKFEASGGFLGEAVGYEGPVAALALDGHGRLLVHTGGCLAPVVLEERGGYVREGFLWGGPFRNPSIGGQPWHWLRAHVELPSPGAHFQLFVYSAAEASPAVPTGDPPWSGGATDFLDCVRALRDWKNEATDVLESLRALRESTVCRETWIRLPFDGTECLIPGLPLDHVWVGAQLTGEGQASVALTQIRLEFDHQGYLQHLPALYREEFQSRQFLARFLTRFESLFRDAEERIRDLPQLFDAEAAPPRFLGWLGGWLALDVPEAWGVAEKRQAIADAFELDGHRGTVEGLRLAVRRFTGVDVRIEEPILNAEWWSLATDQTASPLEQENSILGLTTMLAPAEAQGAVLGTTAVLDGSHLITGEEFGTPLFEDVAHQFTVQMYRGYAYSVQKQREVQALLDREKPAHTAYHLCVLEPRMRVGFQATVGIDSIIAGPVSPTLLGEASAYGTELVLGGGPAGRIGQLNQLGHTTRLGEGAIEA